MSRYDLRFAVVASFAIGGCGPTAHAEPTPAAPPQAKPGRANEPELPPPQRFERDMMMRFHMRSSFDTVRAIERLLIRGKLDEARYFAQSLASEPDAPGLAPWAKQIALVRERAAAVASAPGIDEACRREARLAEACARCHADASAQPEFRPPREAPADQPTIVARMARHRWAADRLWEAAIGDAEDAWRAGLDVLAASSLTWPEQGSDRKALAQRLRQLAVQAQHAATGDRAARTWLYGEILVTCASCHTQSAK